MPVIVVTRLRLMDPALSGEFFASDVAVTEQARDSDVVQKRQELTQGRVEVQPAQPPQRREPPLLLAPGRDA